MLNRACACACYVVVAGILTSCATKSAVEHTWKGHVIIESPGQQSIISRPIESTPPTKGLFLQRVNGIEEADPIAGMHADPETRLTPRAGEYTVTTVRRQGFNANRDDEDTVLFHQRVYGQEITQKPPAIDGVVTADDWGDPPIVRLLRAKQSVEDAAEHLCPCNDHDMNSPFEATARAVWTEDALFLGFEVIDESEHADAPKRVTFPLDKKDAHNDLIVVEVSPQGSQSRTSILINMDTGFDKADAYAWRGTIHSDLEAVSMRTEDGYAVEVRVPAQLLVVSKEAYGVGEAAVQPYQLLDFQMKVFNEGEMLKWQPGKQPGSAIILPDPSALPPSPKRKQLFGGETKMNVSEVATKDPAYLTALPVEYPESATYKPDWLDLKLPWEGTHTIATGYGFESRSWTHQTIDNENSANDFFAFDIDMPIGTPILAAANGRIAQSGLRGDSYGNYIVIDHGNGVQSIYAHLSELAFEVDKGEPEVLVKQGQFLGLSGQSGTSFPHLHFGLHTGARASHSGANVGGKATLAEPISGYYGIRKGQKLTSDNQRF